MGLNDNENSRTGRSVASYVKAILDNLYFSLGTTVQSASPNDVYMALAQTVRNHLIERRRKTTKAHFKANSKFVRY